MPLVLPSSAAAQLSFSLDMVEISVAHERANGVPNASTPYAFESCLEGQLGFNGAELTTPSPVSMHPYTDEGGGEFCLNDKFDTLQDLLAVYPKGLYTIVLTQDDAEQDRLMVDFQHDIPTAYADITSPVEGETVPPDLELPVTWSLAANGCANVGDPASCGIDGFATTLAEALTDDDVFLSIDETPTATSALIPGVNLVDGIAYQLGVVSLDLSESTPMTQGGDSFALRTVALDINQIAIDAAAPDVASIFLFQNTERNDGALSTGFGPYVFELCVEGENIPKAEVVTPVSGTKPLSVDDGELCLEEGFATQQAMTDEFGSGDYTVRLLSKQDVLLDSELIASAFVGTTPPFVYANFVSPSAGALVDPSQDLQVAWAMSYLGGCAPSPELTGCGVTAISLFTIDDTTDEDVDAQIFQSFPALAATVDSSVLVEGPFSLELEVTNGFDGPGSTAGADDYQLFLGWSEINEIQITLPEPSAALAGACALIVLVGLRRRRGASRD